MFESILIANRGEIARRIIRTARRLGVRTVAVCSEADVDAPFVREADVHHVIGPASPRESYLNADRILEVAKREGIDAIHPGYGFLSESARFAERVSEHGITFVGPRPETIAAVGGKLDARAVAERASVPVVPGCGQVLDLDQARAEAERMGFPIIIKAAAGGGGIGMTIVEKEKKLERAFEDAKKKGATFFGDDTVYIEKVIESPAHVEVQILGDATGHVAAIGERDCTVQRRNQKVIEETPSPRIDEPTRAAMLDAARRLGEAVGYVNAGTVEMIYCGSGDAAGQFFFLEVNSRLQVEHPVTEMVTGLDLVEQQLRVAAGEDPSEAVRSARSEGWSIEARVCAEDPDKRFFPSPGRLDVVSFPKRDHVRIDSGVESGSEVSPAYDSLLAKVVAWGSSRDEAADRLRDALADTRLEGVRTNLSIFGPALDDEVFRRGAHDTGFLRDRLGLKS
jgi:acetyl-CoA carboxylase biotin carboxylase subunit